MTSSEREHRDKGQQPPKHRHPSTDTEFLDDPHGRHGGGEESEGRPQEHEPSRDEDEARATDENDELS